MRTAYDAIASLAHNIPRTAQVVMGYVPPSSFAWSQALWNLFPNSVHVRITPSASATGLGIHLLDVERGDATPVQAPGWATTQRRLGQIPSVYCSEEGTYGWQAVQDAFNSAKVAHPNYVVAAYPGAGPTLPKLNGITAIGHQYQSTALYDLSVVADYWPGVDKGATEMELVDQFAINTAGTPVTVRQLFGLIYNALADSKAAPQGQTLYDAIWAGTAAVATANADIKAAVTQLLVAINAHGSAPADPTALATALMQAGLPAEIVTALLALLQKAAPAA